MRGISVFTFSLLFSFLAGCAVEVERGHSGEHRRDDDHGHHGDRGHHGDNDSGGGTQNTVATTVTGAESASEGMTVMVQGAATMAEGLEMMTKCMAPPENDDLARGLKNAKLAHADLDKETKETKPSLEVMQAKILLIKDGMKDMRDGMTPDNADQKAAMQKMEDATVTMDKAALLLLQEEK